MLIYIKASLSGDESDYIIAYKKANPQFPHETTLDQLFNEKQFEAYRALGEHITRRFLDGRDNVAAYSDEKEELLDGSLRQKARSLLKRTYGLSFPPIRKSKPSD